MKVLAGDIGGTHTRLAIVDVHRNRALITRESKLSSREAPGLAPLVRSFLAEGNEAVERACFGVAGPVINQRVRTTNLPWIVDAARLARATNVPSVRLINDFTAVGFGVPLLGPRDLVTLQRGRRDPHGTIALIGAGTGLGEGYLTWNGSRYQVHSSEGGHVTYAAETPLEWGLFNYLAKRYGHVSYERLLSGPGLISIYQYLRRVKAAPARPTVHREMLRDDPAAVISRHGLAGTDRLCGLALDLFVSVFGSQAGNLGLTLLATGGVYIAGGIAGRILPKLTGPLFLAALRQKGRLSPVVARLPVHVVVNPDVGLLGAAAAARR